MQTFKAFSENVQLTTVSNSRFERKQQCLSEIAIQHLSLNRMVHMLADRGLREKDTLKKMDYLLKAIAILSDAIRISAEVDG